ncbi:MAG: nitroreductase family deazaflavin-dependent oxidoreductase [Actinomycetota bacterium]|nr:nitroreductase family deazaflavin-dependent oxidoreductase [Actinomycetota bacterium]
MQGGASPTDRATKGRFYNPLVRRGQAMITAAHGFVYRATGGRLLGSLVSNQVVVLTTIGRRSGARRSVPLFGYPDGEDYIIVASNGGTAGHPGWLLNLRQNPEATLRVGGREFSVRASELSTEEREAWWPRVVRNYRLYDNYQKKTDRTIPLVRLAPAKEITS